MNITYIWLICYNLNHFCLTMLQLNTLYTKHYYFSTRHKQRNYDNRLYE